MIPWRPVLAMAVGALAARSVVAWACKCEPPHVHHTVELVFATADGVDVDLADVPGGWAEGGRIYIQRSSSDLDGTLYAGEGRADFGGEVP